MPKREPGADRRVEEHLDRVVLGVDDHHVEVAACLVDHALPQAHDGAPHLGAVGADDEIGGKQRGGLGHRAVRIA